MTTPTPAERIAAIAEQCVSEIEFNYTEYDVQIVKKAIAAAFVASGVEGALDSIPAASAPVGSRGGWVWIKDWEACCDKANKALATVRAVSKGAKE